MNFQKALAESGRVARPEGRRAWILFLMLPVCLGLDVPLATTFAGALGLSTCHTSRSWRVHVSPCRVAQLAPLL
jgi:hypothetical protein